MTAPPEDNRWTRRYDAVSAVQRRYISLLLLLGAVFLVMGERVARAGPTDADTIEPFGLNVAARALWTFSPVILLLLVLALLGSLRAATFARRKSGHKRLEPFDLHPNFIDMIVYHRSKLPWPSSLAPRLAYPVVLTVFFVEAWWLQLVAWRSAMPRGVPFWISFLATCLLTIPALYRLIPFVRRRLPASWKPPAIEEQAVGASTVTGRAR